MDNSKPLMYRGTSLGISLYEFQRIYCQPSEIKAKNPTPSLRRLNLANQVAYIMKDKTTGLYKIGKSINPKHREKTLQSEKPTIELVKVFKSDIETDLHKEFADLRVRGEWFKLNKVQLKRICAQYE